MTKKERYDNVKNRLSGKERDIFLSLPKKVIYTFFDSESDNDIVVQSLRSLIEKGLLSIEKIEKVEKKKVKKKKINRRERDKKYGRVGKGFIPLPIEKIAKEGMEIVEEVKKGIRKKAINEDIIQRLGNENKNLENNISNYRGWYELPLNERITNYERFILPFHYSIEKLTTNYFYGMGMIDNIFAPNIERNNRIISYYSCDYTAAIKKYYRFNEKLNQYIKYWELEGVSEQIIGFKALKGKLKRDIEKERDFYTPIENLQKDIPTLEGVGFPVKGIKNQVVIDKGVIDYYSTLFGFSFNQAKRKIHTLFKGYPKRYPLINLNINLDSTIFNYLFCDTLSDYISYKEKEKDNDYNLFLSLYSKNCYQLMNELGFFAKRITKKERERIPRQKKVWISKPNQEGKYTEYYPYYPKKGSKKEVVNTIYFTSSLEYEREKEEEEEEEG